ncbi:MAG: hypothetical protein AB7F96_02255 [Beijerinckiaceae bacterium]
MTQLETFAAECRTIFQGPGPLEDKLDRMAAGLGRLAQDVDFVTATFDAQSPDKRVIHMDPDTGIHILAHVFRPGVGGNPHSHAPSWAIYANVRGSTHMREYRKTDMDGGSGSELKIVKRYTMNPGDSRAYPSSAIHSPHHEETAWVVRITGGDLDGMDRWRFKKGRDRIIE